MTSNYLLSYANLYTGFVFSASDVIAAPKLICWLVLIVLLDFVRQSQSQTRSWASLAGFWGAVHRSHSESLWEHASWEEVSAHHHGVVRQPVYTSWPWYFQLQLPLSSKSVVVVFFFKQAKESFFFILLRKEGGLNVSSS